MEDHLHERAGNEFDCDERDSCGFVFLRRRAATDRRRIHASCVVPNGVCFGGDGDRDGASDRGEGASDEEVEL